MSSLKSVKLDSKHAKQLEMSDIHILPCKISYDGQSDVKSYFTNSILKNEASNMLENGFRGRPLNGLHLNLPQNSIGLVLNNNVSENKLEIKSMFDKIYTWQLDNPKISEQNDPFSKAMNDWFSVADLIHSD